MVWVFLIDMAISHTSFLLKMQDKQGIHPFPWTDAFLILWFLMPVNVRSSGSSVREKVVDLHLFRDYFLVHSSTNIKKVEK